VPTCGEKINENSKPNDRQARQPVFEISLKTRSKEKNSSAKIYDDGDLILLWLRNGS